VDGRLCVKLSDGELLLVLEERFCLRLGCKLIDATFSDDIFDNELTDDFIALKF